MSLSNIRSAIKTLVAATNGLDADNIYPYIRLSVNLFAFKSLFKTTNNKINAWMITRLSTSEILMSTSSSEALHNFHIYGYYGLKDVSATEETFQDLIEAVCKKLRENHTLSGTALTCDLPQVLQVTTKSFGGHLVHFCDISIIVHEEILYTTV